MSIELRTGRSGALRPMWYGRYEVNKKRFTLNLGIKIAGNPPRSLSLREEGDAAFERSRAMAQAKLDQIIEESRRKHDSVHLVRRIHEIQTGKQVPSVKLSELADRWAAFPRKRQLNKCYASQCRVRISRFVTFITGQDPSIQTLDQVTPELASDFLASEETHGVTAKTWNDILKLLHSAFKHLRRVAGLTDNPFDDIPTKDKETVFRKPFTPEELKLILDAAQGNDFIRPIITTGICTAMRRGDCCLLRWADVDTENRFIRVKTAKTGQMVEIPMFPMLIDEIARHPNTSEYVFPEQAEMYKTSPMGITKRVRKVFAAAGFRDTVGNGEAEDAGIHSEPHVVHLRPPDCNEQIRGAIHTDRKVGLRRASVRDFHSFRVTWVTLALTAGVPLELVQKVTGHKSVDIVLKHYFQPGREEFRRTIQSAMPQLLTGGSKTPKEQMLEIVDGIKATTWEGDVARLRALIVAL